jgi:hypothetical protein
MDEKQFVIFLGINHCRVVYIKFINILSRTARITFEKDGYFDLFSVTQERDLWHDLILIQTKITFFRDFGDTAYFYLT